MSSIKTAVRNAKRGTISSAAVAVLATNLGAQASTVLLDDDFNSGNTQWDAATGNPATGVTFENGEARVGRPGTPGSATMSTTIEDVTLSADQKVLVTFDYQWENNADRTDDEFTFSINGQGFSELSSPSTDDVNQSFSGTFTIAELGATADTPVDIGVSFGLVEQNESPGTYVAVDNLTVSAVPIPAAAWLFGTALAGLAMSRGRSGRLRRQAALA